MEYPMRKRTQAAWRGFSSATKKGVLAGGVLLLWVAIFSLVGAWQGDRHVEPGTGVTLGNFRRLHLGMTEAQVEAIIGAGERAEDTLHRVLRYAGDGLEVEILFDGGAALAGKCKIHRLHDGMTTAQVESILDEGRASGGRWSWSRFRMPGEDDSGTATLIDKESAVTGHLTKRGYWLQEELRRKPGGWKAILE
jgi:hypothetical protein